MLGVLLLIGVVYFFLGVIVGIFGLFGVGGIYCFFRFDCKYLLGFKWLCFS